MTKVILSALEIETAFDKFTEDNELDWFNSFIAASHLDPGICQISNQHTNRLYQVLAGIGGSHMQIFVDTAFLDSIRLAANNARDEAGERDEHEGEEEAA